MPWLVALPDIREQVHIPIVQQSVCSVISSTNLSEGLPGVAQYINKFLRKAKCSVNSTLYYSNIPHTLDKIILAKYQVL